MSAGQKQAGQLSLEVEPEVDIAAISIGDMLEAEFVQLVVDLGSRVSKHVLLALKDPQLGRTESTGTISHERIPPGWICCIDETGAPRPVRNAGRFGE
jgi:hypothetical protein